MSKSPYSKKKRKAVITLSGISKTFGKKSLRTKVLKDLDLTVYEGEFLMIFGPSGCGKSTLLNTMLGLEKPNAGNVVFFGMDLWKLDEDDRAEARKRHVGIMNQHQYWINSLSVKENTAFPLQLLGRSRGDALIEAEKELRDAKIDHRSRYMARELSAGEQQRVSLARALITDPKIVISDEPTGNLDINSGFEFMDSVKDIQKHGATVVMVTHNPEYLEYADRVVFMLDGRIQKDIETAGVDLKQIRREMTEDLGRFIANGISSNHNGNNNHVKKNIEQDEIYKGIPERIQNVIFSLIYGVRDFGVYFVSIGSFLLKKIVSPLVRMINEVKQSKPMPKNVDEHSDVISSSISKSDIIDLSFKNIMVKKSRTYITVLAMGIGIGFIVFLSSIGYGIQELVISEIASIEEMKQLEIVPAVSSNLEINDKTLTLIGEIDGVSQNLPIISVASKVEYQSSLIDVVAHGVQKTYIEHLPDEIVAGEIFSSDTLTIDEDDQEYVQEAVVNEPLLLALGLSPEDSLGESIGISYVFMDTSSDEVKRTETEYILHTITGVISDENPPIVYIPITNIKQGGFATYTQIMSVLETGDEELSHDVRKKIEAMGYETRSILDTISQVNSAFRYIKMVLMLIGFVALVVSVLGMFNTLTVSLLERTREVGLMKSIGMKSYEIRDLFISEAMLISITGGVIGLILGILEGRVLSLVLTVISTSRGDEAIDITYLPIYLMCMVLVASGFVGFVTGLYPSQRAVKMSALDALRYE